MRTFRKNMTFALLALLLLRLAYSGEDGRRYPAGWRPEQTCDPAADGGESRPDGWDA